MNKDRGGREGALSPEFEAMLRRNGLSAQMSYENGWQLVVQGQDSEQHVYAVTERQMQALSGWGSNSRNKAAYRTFAEIVGGDFSLPKDYVHFRNAGGRVNMGLQDVRGGEEFADSAELHHNAGASVDGHALAMEDGRKGWYREGAHGRAVEVGEIRVEPFMGQDKKGRQELQYRMTAVVDGQHVQMSISQKDYDKFLAVDDYHRMKLFSKVSGLVDMKTRPEAKVPLGRQIMGALVGVAAEGQELTRGRPMPELYSEGMGGPRVYSKPGVDSPATVAARIFDAQMNRDMGPAAGIGR